MLFFFNFLLLLIYFIAKFLAPSELELKKRSPWSIFRYPRPFVVAAEKIPSNVHGFETWDLHARQLISQKYLGGLHTSRGGKWNPNGLLRYTYGNSNKTLENMNLASFYLCLFVNFKCFSKAILWNAISWETEDNYKFLVSLYTHHFRERFTFYSLFCCKSFFRAIYVFIHTRLLRVNTITCKIVWPWWRHF